MVYKNFYFFSIFYLFIYSLLHAFSPPVDNSVIRTNQKTYSMIEPVQYIHLTHVDIIQYGTVHRKHYNNFVYCLALLGDFPQLFVNYFQFTHNVYPLNGNG